jgi:tryptophan-rich sensory protein
MWAHKSIIETARASATISYLLNTFSTYGTERRLFGRTNPEVSQRHDTLITPKGWAFSIWAIIFVGESLGLLLIWTNALYSTEYNEILVPFTYACILQSFWCVFFSKEKMLISAIALTGIALCLKRCSDEISVVAMAASTSEIPYISNILISFPIRIHFAWTTAAALINWNMFIVSLRIPGLEVFPALFSVWIATGIALFRAFFLADSIFPAVLAWAFSAMSGKIRSSPPENFARDASFLEVPHLLHSHLSYSFPPLYACTPLFLPVCLRLFLVFFFVLSNLLPSFYRYITLFTLSGVRDHLQSPRMVYERHLCHRLHPGLFVFYKRVRGTFIPHLGQPGIETNLHAVILDDTVLCVECCFGAKFCVSQRTIPVAVKLE